MPKEIDPKDSPRATAYELWMKAPNPMVTFFKTLDVTNLLTVSRKRNMKYNRNIGTPIKWYYFKCLHICSCIFLYRK